MRRNSLRLCGVSTGQHSTLNDQFRRICDASHHTQVSNSIDAGQVKSLTDSLAPHRAFAESSARDSAASAAGSRQCRDRARVGAARKTVRIGGSASLTSHPSVTLSAVVIPAAYRHRARGDHGAGLQYTARSPAPLQRWSARSWRRSRLKKSSSGRFLRATCPLIEAGKDQALAVPFLAEINRS